MSKADIMSSSRPYLLAIYRKYYNRACENLGVSPDKDKKETENKQEYALSASDYPTEFKKLNKVERKKACESYGSDEDFLSIFSDSTSKYKNLKITD